MKNIIRFASLLFILFSLHSQIAHAQIDEVVVTGYRDGGMDSGVVSTWFDSVRAGAVGPEAVSSSLAASKKAEGEARMAKQKYNDCMSVANAAELGCYQTASGKLASDQSTCQSIAGASAVAGVAGGIGLSSGLLPAQIVGGALAGAAAYGATYANQCYNNANNAKDLADKKCKSDFVDNQAYCRNSSGYTGN